MKVEIKDELLNYKLPQKMQGILFGLMAIGVLSFLAGFFTLGGTQARHGHSNPAWSALLVGVFLVVGVAAAGILFTAISHITGSSWSITIRRVPEVFAKFLPVGLLLFLVVFLGIHDLFEWSHPETVAKDHILKHKSGWLNTPFFVTRLILFCIAWSIMGFFFLKRSVAQDKDKDVAHTKFNAKLSAAYILVFAITFSVTAFDLLMSLTPHWFSTMWGVYIFAGIYQTMFAAFGIIFYILKKQGYLGDLVNENHIHDIGKFSLSFCVFWAYVAFCQFMLIWYANIPEETFWFEQRFMGGWGLLSLLLPFIKFIIPFMLLLNRPNKRDLGFLMKVSVWVVFSQVFELYWIVFPSNFENFFAGGFIVTLGVSLGMIGLFAFIIFKGLEKVKLIPVGDPRLGESLDHHQ